mmetsp:Transcript_53/g.119  ORF Transcript_53/g.119 Transcript_53/m.119 type:complete len:317 (-) Transcript_53:389-1339(-)|eukprot:CAMPEP_0114521752 /NCGR_PEP_ID=MMETSP0109-20121206/20358_1 /TAXON_ID=29199 /ORGANISM="Chlorarachnion reptans, Strain CCCM449" /LENGTH=316 /DNA_ID=CAMNT_0001702887 /DNA_START=256 /DNA_END=1206 /DNA_ORIENTATION=+
MPASDSKKSFIPQVVSKPSSNNEGKAAVQRFLAAGVGAAAAEISTLPIDIAKVRLQTQTPVMVNGKMTMPYNNMVHAMYRVSADEGVFAMWKGIGPALMRQVSYTGLSFVLYEPVRNFVAGKGVKKEDIPFWKRVMAGGIAGGSSIFVMNPTDVVKTQMQAAKEDKIMTDVVKQVWRETGVKGFWRGAQPNIARCFIGNACEIGCYDQFKTTIIAKGLVPEGPLAHFAASGAAGVVSAIFSTPVDVVKTRLMNAAGNKEALQYNGVIDCFVNMPRKEGIASLYKGFWPLAMRKVLWTVAFFLVNEQALKAIRGSYS